MKVLFVWSGLSGYMGDCWRALAATGGVELKVAVDAKSSLAGGRFDAAETMRGIDWSDSLPSEAWSPDVIFTVGWHNPLCRAAALREWGGARKVCCFDMPWEWRLRKIAARFVLWRYLRRFDAAFVSGMVAARYARWLGFGDGRVFTGLFSTNISRFGTHVGGKGFLYVGRDSPEKGLDVLRKAHELYRLRGGTWPLEMVNGVSPDDLGPIYAAADCFVLASRHEPWGVVLVEAAAAGLPIICTEACGARHEVVNGNGIVVPKNDAEALASAMAEVAEGKRTFDLEEGRRLASKYSCEEWSRRVMEICKELCNV